MVTRCKNMKIRNITQLVDDEFEFKFLNALRQFWRDRKTFRCIGNPKQQNLFLLLDGCSITYVDKDKRIITAGSGDIVYTPKGSEYKAELSEFCDSDSHTVGINFLLFDENGEEIVLSKDITVFHPVLNSEAYSLFHRILLPNTTMSSVRNKIIFLEILCALASDIPLKTVPDRISKALEYLSNNIEKNPTVAELADMCNISEVCFRKQFKEKTGMTPIEYRNKLRLKKAESYLEYGDISIQEISDMLGYSTVSHFIKEFRLRYGKSPYKYKKQLSKKI